MELDPNLARVVRESADPDGVTMRLERFRDLGGQLPAAASADPVDEDARRLLVALLASGTFLPELLFADVTAWPALAADRYLRRTKPTEVTFAEAEAAVRGAADFDQLKRGLRLYRRREMLRLGARELGWGSTEEVAGELSALAEAALELSYRFCEVELRCEWGDPVSEDADEPPAFVVLAMGKLGGEELNFSSDVDVIYFYSTDAGQVALPGATGSREPRTLHAFYAELSRRITAALDDVTADGLVFRVDLRLRPEGRGGPLCNSLAAAERYYETFGRTWERQALLRARPAAGDRTLGDRLLGILEPFVFRRHTDASTVDDIRKLRAQFVPGRSPEGDGGFDVKLGTGGIRDVELVVQSLQLLHGGKRKDIRERHTPRALRRLAVAGLLSDREARTLGAAYRFWRQLEHRVQMRAGAQTHRLPGDDAEHEVYARSLGFTTGAALDAEIATRRAEVEEIVRTFDAPEPDIAARVHRAFESIIDRADLEAALADLGFADVDAAADSVELVRARLPIELFAEAIASPDPDRSLGHFRELALRASVGLLALVRADPQLRRALATLFGVSERLSRLLIAYPDMWDPFVDGLGEPTRSRAALDAALAARLRQVDVTTADAGGSAEEDEAREMRIFQTEEHLRIGLHDVAGSLAVRDVARQLTEVAEACLVAALDRLLASTYAKVGSDNRPAADLTVLGMGSLGAYEMRYGSDLDLVFLYSDEGETKAGVTHGEFFAKIARRLMSAFGAVVERGRLYEIDARLRPSGEQGVLVTSYRAFERYHEQEAAGWERVALLRARVVYSTATSERRGAVEDLLRRVAYDRPVDDLRFRTDLRRVRERVLRERGRVAPGSCHLRFDSGGIMDIEFLSALGQLRDGAADPALRTTETAAALVRLVERGWPEHLIADHDLLRSLAMRMRLLRDRPEDVIAPRDFLPLGRSYERDPEQLRRQIAEAMARVHPFYRAQFGEE